MSKHHRSLFQPPERRTRADLAVTAVIAIGAVGLGLATWWGSDARDADLQVYSPATQWSDSVSAGAQPVPTTVEQAWSAPTKTSGLLVDARGGVGIEKADGTFEMLDADSGTPLWSYHRSEALCAAAIVWDQANLVYEGPKGCGQAVSIKAATGEYEATRDALAPQSVDVFHSRDKLGLISPKTVELWRSDLVRTVIVGNQEAPAKPNLQEHLECTFTSALTRTSLLATAQTCPGQEKKLVRLLKTVPKESDQPEKIHEFTVPAGSELVAIGQQAAVIYIPGNGRPARDPADNLGARFQVLNKDGTFQQYPAQVAPPLQPTPGGPEGIYEPQTADLAHNMTWFDGARLVAFKPGSMEPDYVVEGALGTGASMGQRLLVPTAEGIAVVNWTTGKTERTIPVDRGGYAGPVTLRVAGKTIVEQRGEQIVALRAIA